MKKQFFSILLTVAMVMGLLPQMTMPAWATGDTAYSAGATAGTEGLPVTYTISTEEQLRALATTVTKGTLYQYTTFVLQDVIALTKGDWTPIGNDETKPFNGTFDGNGKKITGVKIGSSGTPNTTFGYVGLFGCVNGGTIKNLGVDVAICSNGDNVTVGGLVGINKRGTITNCYSTGEVTGENARCKVGGLAGYAPPDQQQLSLNNMTYTKVSRFPDGAYRLGISIVLDKQQWDLLNNGTFYRFEDKGLEAECYVYEDTQLYNQIIQILSDDLGFAPFAPTQVTGLAAAELSYTPGGSGEAYTQRIEDGDKLLQIERLLSSVDPIGGITACPFNEAVLTLKLNDGAFLQVRLATDSCAIYFANGVCFDYGETNKELLGIFDEIPWNH